MDISRRAAGVAAAAASLALIAGCGAAASAPASSGGPRVSPAAARLVGDVEPLHPGSLTAAEVAADNTAFGWDLYGRVCRQRPTGNVALSPASAAQALGMVDAGAVGATATAVSRVLALPPWSPAVVAALHDQAAALAAIPQLVVTNHVFEQTGVRPTVRTLDDLRTAFASDLRQVDFAGHPQRAVDQINAVIDRDTDGLIPSLFDQPLDRQTQTVLADAILLDAKWSQPFTESAPQPFHTAAGKTVTAALMDSAEGSFASRSAGGPWSCRIRASLRLSPSCPRRPRRRARRRVRPR
jgi:serpin B